MDIEAEMKKITNERERERQRKGLQSTEDHE